MNFYKVLILLSVLIIQLVFATNSEVEQRSSDLSKFIIILILIWR